MSIRVHDDTVEHLIGNGRLCRGVCSASYIARRIEQKGRKFFFDPNETDISELMTPPRPEMSAIRYIFPFRSDDPPVGFMPLPAAGASPPDESKLAASRF